jgi:hypothetical protein
MSASRKQASSILTSGFWTLDLTNDATIWGQTYNKQLSYKTVPFLGNQTKIVTIILVILNVSTKIAYQIPGNKVMAQCIETGWKPRYNCNYMSSEPTVSGERPIANSDKLHTVNIKWNIQMLRQTPITSLFKNLELIWTLDGSVYTTTEICIDISSVNLCITKREGTAPKWRVYDNSECLGGKLI